VQAGPVGEDIGGFILDRKLEIKITKIEKKSNVSRMKT